ncbi:MAG: TetR/AcrR family transcriptional regulator [Cyanobacteria bacterium J06638_28]
MLEMSKEIHLPRLFELFRHYGYDGATLSKIAEATGLGKASLYHHFPGGKEDMVASVLDYSEAWLHANVLLPLASEGTTQERLQKMCDRINDLYAGGTQPCLLAILHSGNGRDLFHDKIKATLATWIGAIATVLMESGWDATTARHRGADAIVAIQGALMVSQGLDDPALFQRVIKTLPQNLTAAG